MNGPPRSGLLCDLVVCLDTSGELAKVTATLLALPPAPQPPDLRLNDSFSSYSSTSGTATQQLTFRPAVNVALVADTNSGLARIIMEEPATFRSLLQTLILRLARSLGVEGLLQTQVVAIPCVSGLLPFYEHEVTPDRWLGGMRASPRLLSLRHTTLVSLSEKVKYVSSASYLCLDPSCAWRGDDSAFVRVFGPAQGGERRSQECLGCGGVLQEQYSRRDVSERVTGRLVVAGRSSVLAIFRQEEAALLRLGGNYSLVFSLVHERAGVERLVMLEVCGVEHLVPALHRQLVVTGAVQLPLSLYCTQLRSLHHRCSSSPWSFVRNLALCMVSSEVLPPTSLLRLRLALLLSLASSGQQLLHLLATGPDLVLAHRLLRAALLLSPRSLLHSPTMSLVGTKDKDSSGASCLQAGLLHRARGGVLYLGEVAGLKPATRQVVVSVLETGVVSSPALGRSSPLEQPLECAVWGLAEGGTVCTGKKNCA